MAFDLKLDLAIVAENLGHHDPSFTMSPYISPRGSADEGAMRVTDGW